MFYNQNNLTIVVVVLLKLDENKLNILDSFTMSGRNLTFLEGYLFSTQS